MPRIVCLGGFLDAWPGLPSIARDLAELDPLVIPAPRWGNNWRQHDWKRVHHRLPTTDFVVCGFSDGAPIAVEVAQRHARCVGLVFISGLFRPVPPADMWRDFPALFLCTGGEKASLIEGTLETYFAMGRCMADVQFTRAAQPDGVWWPHLLGVGHQQETIRRWMEANFG